LLVVTVVPTAQLIELAVEVEVLVALDLLEHQAVEVALAVLGILGHTQD
jgi:hypothetical protein